MVRKKPNPTPSPKLPAGSLLGGEEVEFDSVDVESVASDEELNKRYAKGEARIVTENARYSLAGILAMLEERVPNEDGTDELRYKLDPEYQRRHRWSEERKSRLIESFLMNVPVPPVFLYERDLARFEVMDGRQRLTALSEFYGNKFKLAGLQYWKELNGRTHATLPVKVRDGIDRRYLSSIILLKETAQTEEKAAELKKSVFERLNSGGVALSHQETRNAVYDGPLNRLCLDLSDNTIFRGMWGIPNESEPTPPEPREDDDADDTAEPEATKSGKNMFEKMDDVELVLRFFAYRQIASFPGGLNRISAFLDRFLSRGNSFGPKIFAEYRSMFTETISFLNELTGPEAFCRLNVTGEPRGRPTKIVFDPLMFVASRYSRGATRAQLLQHGNALRRALGAMYDREPKLFAGRSTNTSDALARNAAMESAFTGVLAAIAK